MEPIEIIQDNYSKKPTDNKRSGNSFSLLVFVVLITIAIAEGYAAYVFMEINEVEKQEIKEQKEKNLKQATALEFKYAGTKELLNKKEKMLEKKEQRLKQMEIVIKEKESKLIAKETFIETISKAAINSAVNTDSPENIAEDLMERYLEKYSSVDFTQPKPCNKEERDIYVAAKVNLDALNLTAMEINSGNNRYSDFVKLRFENLNLTQLECDTQPEQQKTNEYQDDTEETTNQNSEEEYEEEY
ncbi:MAG: hypothetical protein D6B27_00645 [Gammaproteobacteria bacterium]|nr:MAG: hypothetical protein D6B27_00645 [Gammaproteobacteria bacterium]